MKNQFFISVYDPGLHLKQVSQLASGAPSPFGKDASVSYAHKRPLQSPVGGPNGAQVCLS
jgi:hypothetical protein